MESKISAGSRYVNILLNKGDAPYDVEVFRFKVSRQSVGTSSKMFREALLSSGFGHSFWKDWLWVVPVNGRPTSAIGNLSIPKFGINLTGAELYNVKTFDDDYFWQSVGIVLLRDAIRYSLWNRLRGHTNIRLMGLKFYDLNSVISSGMTVYVVTGISLGNIVRVNSNIAISPMLELELLDTSHERVEDQSLRAKYLTSARSRVMVNYKQLFDKMLDNVLPLEVSFSNKLFKFERPFLDVKGSMYQKRLDEWF